VTITAAVTATATAAAVRPIPATRQPTRRVRDWLRISCSSSPRPLRTVSLDGPGVASTSLSMSSSSIECLLADRRVQPLAGTAEPGADRPGGDAKCLRHFFVAELAQCH
jgi:hypothetical protein